MKNLYENSRLKLRFKLIRFSPYVNTRESFAAKKVKFSGLRFNVFELAGSSEMSEIGMVKVTPFPTSATRAVAVSISSARPET